MLVTDIYVCSYCLSPRIQYAEYVRIEGVSLEDGSTISSATYLDDSDYCENCDDETYTAPALLVFHDGTLYMLTRDRHTEQVILFTVPHEIKGGDIIFTGRPTPLGSFLGNDITVKLIDTIRSGHKTEERGLALEAILNLVDVHNSSQCKGGV